jgi:hypothetical protein
MADNCAARVNGRRRRQLGLRDLRGLAYFAITAPVPDPCQQAARPGIATTRQHR